MFFLEAKNTLAATSGATQEEIQQGQIIVQSAGADASASNTSSSKKSRSRKRWILRCKWQEVTVRLSTDVPPCSSHHSCAFCVCAHTRGRRATEKSVCCEHFYIRPLTADRPFCLSVNLSIVTKLRIHGSGIVSCGLPSNSGAAETYSRNMFRDFRLVHFMLPVHSKVVQVENNNGTIVPKVDCQPFNAIASRRPTFCCHIKYLSIHQPNSFLCTAPWTTEPV